MAVDRNGRGYLLNGRGRTQYPLRAMNIVTNHWENAWNPQNTFIFKDYETNKVSPLIEKLAGYVWPKNNAVVLSFQYLKPEWMSVKLKLESFDTGLSGRFSDHPKIFRETNFSEKTSFIKFNFVKMQLKTPEAKYYDI